MKLVVITAFYPPHQAGGYELRCKDVLDGLKGRGHEVLILTTRCPNQPCSTCSDDPQLCRALHVKTEAPNVLVQIAHDRRDLIFIDKQLRQFKPDIIYLWHIQNLSNAILPYLSEQQVPLVYDEGSSGLIYLSRILGRGLYFYENANDSMPKRMLKRGVYWTAGAVSSHLIKTHWKWPENMRVYFNSHSSLEHSRSLGVPVEKASVIHSAIALADFPYRPRHSIHPPVRILVPGRIKAVKGTKDAILLARALVEHQVDVQVRIVGAVQSVEYYREILEGVQESGLSKTVETLPMVSQTDLARFYQESDICFVPTYLKAGFSRVPLEAMASGSLVITYENEGSREAIRSGETGFVVPEGDIAGAASCIEAMMMDPAQYRKITQDARGTIESEYSIERYLDAIESYLHESLSKRSPAKRSKLKGPQPIQGGN